MGILDGYAFDPSTYAGSGAPPGWLGLLLGGGLPFNAQQPQGFPDQLPANAQPTSGGVTLPQTSASGFGREAEPQNPFASLFSRAGDAVGSLFSPSQANAQPAPQASPVTPQGPGMLDRLTAGATNFTTGGNPIAGIMNMIGGLATGQRTDPAGIMQQHVLSVYQALKPALLAKGASPEQAEALARAGALDPEVRKTIASTLYQAPQLVNGGTNPLTGEVTHEVYNPNNQSLSRLSATQGGGASQTLTPANAAAVGLPPMSNNELQQIQDLNRSGLTGDDYFAKLKAINPAFADKTKSMANGDLPYPSGFIMKTPYGNMLTDAISAVKPGVTAQDYGLKQKNRAYWASGGAGAAEVKAINTAIRHAAHLAGVSDQMGGTDVAPGYLNPVIQGYKVNTGDTQFQDAQKDWDATSETLATEISKALNGGKPNVADKEHWRQIFSNTSGPAQRMAAIKSAMAILQGRTVTQAENYEQGMGSLKDPLDFISPENQESFQRLQAGLPPKQSGQTAHPQQPQQSSGAPPKIATQADWAKLPKGTQYVAPDGTVRTKQ